jgi:hypothetical protein
VGVAASSGGGAGARAALDRPDPDFEGDERPLRRGARIGELDALAGPELADGDRAPPRRMAASRASAKITISARGDATSTSSRCSRAVPMK